MRRSLWNHPGGDRDGRDCPDFHGCPHKKKGALG